LNVVPKIFLLLLFLIASFDDLHADTGPPTVEILCLTVASGVTSYGNEYDTLYRLNSEVSPKGKSADFDREIFYDSAAGYGDPGYDRVGNRRFRSFLPDKTPIGGLESAKDTFNANDQLTRNLYDKIGNTLQGRTGLGKVVSEEKYDFQNRLISAVTPNGTVNLLYDGDGNLIRKTVGDKTTWFLVDALNPTGYAQVLEELEGAPSSLVVTRDYFYNQSRLIQDLKTGVEAGRWAYGYDGHGNVRFLMRPQSGEIVQSYSYDAFGVLLDQTKPVSGEIPNRFLYTGEQWDPDLGLYFLRARYYNPATGRLWSMDSYEGNHSDPISLHKYLYCAADPVNRTDPSGNESLLNITATMGIITTLANITTTSLANYSIGKHLVEKGAVPDAVFFNFGGGGSSRGYTAGANLMLYYDFKQRSLYALGSIEAGLAPVSIFKKQGGWGYMASAGFAFNAQGPSDFSGWGFTATWPAVMAKTVIPKKLSGWYYFLTTMAARNSVGTQLSKGGGVVQYGYSTSGAAYIGFGAHFNSFSATVGYASDPIPIGQIPDDISLMIQDATRARETPAITP